VRGRFVAATVTVLVVVASCAGCSSSDQVTQKTARIRVDNQTRTSHAVICSQVQWLLTANIASAPATVSVLLRLSPDEPKPGDSDKPKRDDSEYPKLESVNINNFGGFYGVADTKAADAKVVFANGTYTITGTAEGSHVNDSRVSLTAPFKIEVGC
jgi:ipoprotein LpqH